ncbi:hypothetical protein [Streptomyces sp. NPDC050355]|uniref:hypothetical protein n=1 Tax=Streptomyces sp. NPDC050355 TaxID=3365609 RepID=UPI00378A248C
MPETTAASSRTGRLLAAPLVLILSVGSLTACGPTDDGPHADGTRPSSVTSPSVTSPSASGPSAPGAPSVPAAGKTAGTGPTTRHTASSSPAAGRDPDDPDDRLHQWMESGSIPMNASYHWPMLDTSARLADGEKFLFEEHCGARRTPETDSLARAAWMEKARPGKNDGDQNWLAQETIAAHLQDGKRKASALFGGLAKELQACGSAHTSVTYTTRDSRHVAATIVLDKDTARPTTLHEYLAVVGDNVLELSLWATPYHQDGGNKPDVAWPGPPDTSVFRAMTTPVCPQGKQC